MATVLLCFAKGLMPVVTPREAKPSSTSASVEMMFFLKSCRFCPKGHIIYKIRCIILHHIACWKQTLHLPGCLRQDYSRLIVDGGIPSLGRKPMVGLEPPEARKQWHVLAGWSKQTEREKLYTHLMILIEY